MQKIYRSFTPGGSSTKSLPKRKLDLRSRDCILAGAKSGDQNRDIKGSGFGLHVHQTILGGWKWIGSHRFQHFLWVSLIGMLYRAGLGFSDWQDFCLDPWTRLLSKKWEARSVKCFLQLIYKQQDWVSKFPPCSDHRARLGVGCTIHRLSTPHRRNFGGWWLPPFSQKRADRNGLLLWAETTSWYDGQ